MKPVTLLALLLALVFTSCSKKKGTIPAPDDYFIYGYTGGFVPPDARTTYFRIANGELRGDTSQLAINGPADVNMFNFNLLLPATEYNKVADLPYVIPSELYAQNNKRIGYSKYVDGGFLEVRVRRNGVAYKWLFDSNQDTSSAAVQNFVNRLR